MSDAISRRIKQLENQNEKFKKLLESTLQITSEDTIKCLQLQNEANFLKKVVSDLENQKRQLEEELKQYLAQDVCKLEVNANVDIQNKLSNTVNDIQRGSNEMQKLKTEDEYLRTLLFQLEAEKEKLLGDVELVKKANEENNTLAQENLKLREELALLKSSSPSNVSPNSGQDLVKRLASIENLKQNLENEIKTAQLSSDPLGIPIENTVLELKISGLEKQKENTLKQLRANLLQGANEISMLHSDTSDSQLRGLLNELDIHKTILMMNMSDIKEMQSSEEKEKCEVNCDDCNEDDTLTTKEEDLSKVLKEDVLNSVCQRIDVKQFLSSDDVIVEESKELATQSKDSPEPKLSSSFSTNSSEIIEEVTEIRDTETTSNHSIDESKSEDELNQKELGSHELLPTVSEEDEAQNDLIIEHEQLKEEISRLERERDDLLQQIQSVNFQSWEMITTNSRTMTGDVLHGTFMREESSEEVHKLPLDDATNQMFVNEEQLLAQRIRELEEDNERIRRDLNALLEEAQGDKEELDVLEEGERLIRDYKGGVVENVEQKNG